jgi:hypothetical protein
MHFGVPEELDVFAASITSIAPLNPIKFPALLSWYLGCESEIVRHHLRSLVSHKRVIGIVIIIVIVAAAGDGYY